MEGTSDVNGSGSRDLRAACRRRVRELGVAVPSPFRAVDYCAALARHRDRPIVVRLVTAGGAGYACGVWLATPTLDIILVEKAASPEHQDHIIAHELGHMAFDHYGALEPQHGALSVLVPSLDPALVQRVLGRNAYTAQEEQEAEVFASVLMTMARRPANGAGSAGMEQVDRFASALEPDGRWHG